MKRALISVSDKRGILEFARGLAGLKIEILSTGGTAKLLKENKIPVIEVGDYTGQPEILDGRLKTLHPKIHGGILAIRSNPKHVREIAASGIEPIDLLVVNLYPFEETIAKANVTLEEAVENIDIGGPTMIRAAAKNWQDVTVVVDPEDYPRVLEELRKGGVSQETNFHLAKKVFILTARYDGAIANYLTGEREQKFPEVFNYQGVKVQDLRYGENPHQKAAFYTDVGAGPPRPGAGTAPLQEPCVANARQLHGKELSYNNIMDLDAAVEAAKEFRERAVVIIKHATPCGVAIGGSLRDIFIAARDCDPLSAFGGIIAVNDQIDVPTAEAIGKDFYECVISASYDDEAFRILAAKKNIRLMEISAWDRSQEWSGSKTFRKVTGGLLVQDRDLKQFPVREGRVVTKRRPSEEEWRALEFAWKVVKHVKSNAIVYAAPHPPLSPRQRRRGGEGRDYGDRPAGRIGQRRGGDPGRRRAWNRHGLHRRPALPALKIVLWVMV